MVGQVLEAISSRRWLARRFGALVARKIEQEQGREMLIRSIRDPEIFDTLARRLAGLA